MAMSQEHKDALARGRVEARSIKAYLSALESRKPGRPVTRDVLENRLTAVREKIEAADDLLQKVDLIQSRLDIEKAIANIAAADDFEALEAGFVEHAASYSGRKGISYTAWREAGVAAAVLRAAGVKETRRR